MNRSRLRAAALVLATAVLTPLALTLTSAPAAAAEPGYGFDVSWPQCPRGSGNIPGRQGLGLPMPPPESEFMIIGLTNGPAFTPNPCLASQVAYARDRGQWTAGYAVTSFPNQQQLDQHGGSGTRLQRLNNVGAAQARYNVANLRAAGLRTPMIWVDIEPVSSAPWPSNQTENNALIDGVLRGYAEAGLRTGWYSYKSAWDAITGGRRSTLPTWVPAGKADRQAALRKCAEPSFSGGPVIFGQWTDEVYDFNVTCPGRSSTAHLSPPDASHDPIGSVDGVQLAPGGVRVRGWTLDPDTSDSIDVHLYAGNQSSARRADVARPDVGAAFGKGEAHGLDAVVPSPAGRQSVCAFGINSGPGYDNTRVGCQSVQVPAGPFGSFDTVTRVPGGLRVGGWAIDPATAGPIRVHGYVGGAGTAATADRDRPDVGRVFPNFGAGHGLDAVLAAPGSGSQRVCLFGIGGSNPSLGCKDVVVSHTPFGSLDAVAAADGGVRVQGWAIHPDTVDPVQVQLVADGVQVSSVAAAASRPDVGAAFPPYGSARGFDGTVAVPQATRTVCARAVVPSGAPAVTLGCRTLG